MRSAFLLGTLSLDYSIGAKEHRKTIGYDRNQPSHDRNTPCARNEGNRGEQPFGAGACRVGGRHSEKILISLKPWPCRGGGSKHCAAFSRGFKAVPIAPL